MALFKLTSNDGWIPWIDPKNAPQPVMIPAQMKHPSNSQWEHKFTNRQVYGRNYFLIYPTKFDKLPKNEFKFNTPHQYAFEDAWIKP